MTTCGKSFPVRSFPVRSLPVCNSGNWPLSTASYAGGGEGWEDVMVSLLATSSYEGGSQCRTVKFADSSLEGVLECVLLADNASFVVPSVVLPCWRIRDEFL